jgi:thioredoxin reductase
VRVVNKGIAADSARLSFVFNDQSYEALEGDSIASALVNVGVYALKKNSDGSNRGVYCGMGVCNECEVTVDGKEGELACMTSIKQNMVIETQNQIKKPPVKLDGGVAEENLSPHVLVIGGGPAGLTAASVLARTGLDVLVIDERSALGGQYFKQPASTFTVKEKEIDEQFRLGRKLITDVESSGVRIIRGTRIWAAFGANHFLASSSDRNWVITPQRTIIATGAYEKSFAVPGWTLPGVMSTGAAQTLLRTYQVSLGRKVAISGNGPLNIQLAAELILGGVHVVGLAESAKIFRIRNLFRGFCLFYFSPKLTFTGLGYFLTIWKARTPFQTRSVATSMAGKLAVESVTFSKADKLGNMVKGSQRQYVVDAVALGFGFSPSNEIARSLGCEHTFDEKTNSLIARLDNDNRSTVKEVWIVGDSSAVLGAQVASANGTVAAFSILKELGIPLSPPQQHMKKRALRIRRRSAGFQKILWRIFEPAVSIEPLASESTIICRCLSLTKADICQDLQPDVKSAGSIKRLKRVGMGKCQGRYCAAFAVHSATKISHEPLNEFSSFAPQLPFKPTPIRTIAYPDDDAK